MSAAPDLEMYRFHVRETPEGRFLAETSRGAAVYRSYLRGARPEGAAPVLPWIDRGAQVAVPAGDAPGAAPATPERFRARNVLLGLRLSEDASALGPWLSWHAAGGFDAALIIDARGETSETWRPAVEAAGAGALPVTIVTADTSLAGITAAGEPVLTEPVMLDAVRHRFLSEATTVACLGLAELILAPADALARLHGTGAAALLLDGRRAYPWRLRKGAPAPVSDHIYTRGQRRPEFRRWIAAPGRLAEGARLDVETVQGADLAPADSAVVRAMGVAHPGVAPKTLVDKAELVEDDALAAAFAGFFETRPLRRREAGRAPGVPGDEIVLVTAMKNEGPFILDWLAHHLAIGVDRVVVYTNDCADGTDDLLTALSASGRVEHFANPYRQIGKVPQRAAFDAARATDAVRGAGWLMTLDVDEYLNIHAGEGRLADLFAARHEANVFSIPWRLFGSGDIASFEDVPVTRQFTRCAPAFCPKPHQAWGFKTLYRNAGLFRRLGVHRPLGLAQDRIEHIRWVDGSGRPLPRAAWRKGWRMTATTWGYNLASVNHYAVRSAESYLVKRDRGRVNHTDRDQGTAYWFRMNQNAEEDLSIRRLAAEADRCRTDLAALPGVAELHARAVDWHLDRIAVLKADPAYAALYAEITGERLQRLARMPGRFGSSVYLAGPDVIPDEVLARDPDGDWTYAVANPERRD